jgi:hypothetical protein
MMGKLPFAVLLFCASAPLSAIIIQDEVAHASYYNVSSSEFNGIGRLYLSGAGRCSAFAINAFQVLTAAHCIPSANPDLLGLSLNGVQFPLFDSTIHSPTAVFISPGWIPGDYANGNDLAVLYFENGLPGVNTYPLLPYNFAGDELGLTFELFGYGRCGSPTAGYEGANGTCATPGLHRAANRYDSLTPNENVLLYSFDSYNPALSNLGSAPCPINDALCILNQTVYPSKADDPAIGTRQGITAPGDSGGPSLIFFDGRYYAAGLHSYIACLATIAGCLSPPDWDGSTGPNGTFGEIGADTRLSFHSDFIAGAVPEPSTFFLAAGALLAVLRRRYMLRSIKSGHPQPDPSPYGENASAHCKTQSQLG